MNTAFTLIDWLIFIAVAVYAASRFFSHKLPRDERPAAAQPARRQPAEALGALFGVPPDPAAVTVEAPDDAKPMTPGPAAALPADHPLHVIQAADPQFDASAFLTGAEAAYTWYYQALSANNVEALKDLLGAKLFKTTQHQHQQLEKNHQRRQVVVNTIKHVTVRAAKLLGKTAVVEVGYEVELIDVVTALEAPTPTHPVTVCTEVLTWARNLNSDDPNWDLEAIARV